MAWQVDLERQEYVAALGRIPVEFRDLVCRHLEEVAARLGAEARNGPAFMVDVMDSTIGCVLSGVAGLRWYLLYSPDRTELARHAWMQDGVMGVALYLRELNLAERVLLVSGYGHATYESVESKLSSLKAEMGISLVATTHGPLTAWVRRWALEAGIPCAHLPLEDDDSLIERISAQCLEAIEMFTPKAVCALTSESLALRLIEIAIQRKVPRISAPEPISPIRAVLSSPRRDDPVERAARRGKRYVALIKPPGDGS